MGPRGPWERAIIARGEGKGSGGSEVMEKGDDPTEENGKGDSKKEMAGPVGARDVDVDDDVIQEEEDSTQAIAPIVDIGSIPLPWLKPHTPMDP